MIIGIFMAIGLVIIVAGGFLGRNRMARRSEPDHQARNPTHKGTHHGKGGHKSRGRGRGH